MDVFFRSRKLAKIFNSQRELRKQYGDRMAKTIMIRLAVLKNAPTLARVPATSPERRHRLAGRRKGQCAVDLVHSYRLVFEPTRGTDGSDDAGSVTAITIIEVVDYH